MVTKPEFLVAKDEVLVAVATVFVAILKTLTMHLSSLWMDNNFKERTQNVLVKCTYSKFGLTMLDL